MPFLADLAALPAAAFSALLAALLAGADLFCSGADALSNGVDAFCTVADALSNVADAFCNGATLFASTGTASDLSGCFLLRKLLRAGDRKLKSFTVAAC